MSSVGIMWWNHGQRCLARLAVSIWSASRHSSAPFSLLNEGEPPPWMSAFAKRLGVTIWILPPCHDYGLVKKSRLWRTPPYDRTVYLDSDTLIVKPLAELVEAASGDRCVLTRFAEWGTSRGRMAGRIKPWEKVDPERTRRALGYGYAINTGIMGWVKGDPLLALYEELTAKGMAAGMARKTLDEIAMQIAAPGLPHTLLDDRWNTSCIYGALDRAHIIHYHGHKHVRDNAAGALWKAAFRELLVEHPELAPHLDTPRQPDKSLAMWIRESGTPGRLRDMTIVTAVNPIYAERAKRSFALWAATPGLREQRFLVFVNGFAKARDRAWITKVLPEARVVRWEHEAATARETMLAAFVLGVPRHVQTKFWMKLDADTVPVAGEFRWPEYRDYTVTSHRWGYTKMKGAAPGESEHWFNRLDRMFAGAKPLFGKLDPVADFKVSHRRGNRHGVPMRFASFAHIERTDFTRRVAKACAGRLPIPSHDTLAWYFTALWKEPVKLVNMKEQFRP